MFSLSQISMETNDPRVYEDDCCNVRNGTEIVASSPYVFSAYRALLCKNDPHHQPTHQKKKKETPKQMQVYIWQIKDVLWHTFISKLQILCLFCCLLLKNTQQPTSKHLACMISSYYSQGAHFRKFKFCFNSHDWCGWIFYQLWWRLSKVVLDSWLPMQNLAAWPLFSPKC